jgi:hypothetical protein
MMRRTVCAITFVLSLAGFANAGFWDLFYGRSWSYMESVGGISVGVPTRDQNGVVHLPVSCDVSGLTTITRKPTAISSAMVVTGINKKIEDHEIIISVDTGLVSEKWKWSTCSAVSLGDIPAGDYKVLYYGADREKHGLGKVTVPPN